jgi:N-acetylglutamate synthase-like GNAT family acetyltransferase
MKTTIIQVRRATVADAAGIASLLSDSFIEYRHLYTTLGYDATAISAADVTNRIQEGPAWVAICDEAIVGTVSIVLKENSLYVRGMAVHPAARGRKIGELLLSQIETFARAEKIQRLFLSTTPFLNRAIRLYERFGFERVDEGAQDLFGTTLFTMEKRLLPSDDRQLTETANS